TWNMCPQALQKAFHQYERQGLKPKAVIVVNLYGQPAKYNEILDICDYYDVPIIEDAAESLGSIYSNCHSGNIGNYSILSFNGNKIITTSGGGMLLSNNEHAIAHALYLAT
ncbi:DegT/DnrJ/EryC1/StrS family aminotransferase, partial [Staphylococcus arlettae]